MRHTHVKIWINAGLALLLLVGQSNAWDQWRGPERDGSVEDFSVPDRWPKQIGEFWSVDLGGGDASPVVEGRNVYTHSRQGDQEVVSKLDLEFGDVIWQDRYGPIDYLWLWPGAESRGKGPFSTPALSNGRLFTFGVTQTLSTYDTESGEVLWRKAFDKTLDFGTSTSPIVVGDLVIVHVGDAKVGALMALDVATGDVRWESDYDGMSYASPVLVDLHGVRQLVVLSSQYLSSFVPETGEALWRADAPHPFNENISMPVLVGATFVVSSISVGTKGIRIDREGNAWSASQIWHNERLATYTSSPCRRRGEGLRFCESAEGSLLHAGSCGRRSGMEEPGSPGRVCVVSCVR